MDGPRSRREEDVRVQASQGLRIKKGWNEFPTD